MQKFQHFLFTNVNLDVIKTQCPFQKFNLLKAGKSEVPMVIKKNKNLIISSVGTSSMKYEQQEYIFIIIFVYSSKTNTKISFVYTNITVKHLINILR